MKFNQKLINKMKKIQIRFKTKLIMIIKSKVNKKVLILMIKQMIIVKNSKIMIRKINIRFFKNYNKHQNNNNNKI